MDRNGKTRSEAIDHVLNGLSPTQNGHGGKGLFTPGDHERGYKRNTLTAEVKAAVEAFPDEMRAELMGERYRVPFLASLEHGLQRGDRTALNIYSQATKLLGTHGDIAVQIVNLIGAPADRARTAVEAMDRVEVMPKDARARKMASWLTEYCIEAGLPAPVFPNALLSAEVR